MAEKQLWYTILFRLGCFFFLLRISGLFSYDFYVSLFVELELDSL